MSRRLMVALLFLSGVSAVQAQSGERILAFHSDLTVRADSSVVVRETIRVNALGQNIRRGIYRDFPTTYRDARRNKIFVGFDVQSVERDGSPEAYHTERLANGVRVYFGRKDYLLPAGEHEYELTYLTTHQMVFFDGHDELYWNVTGNGWAFPIDVASATVTLPEGIDGGDLRLEAYTGPQGARDTNYTASSPGPGRAAFATTRPMRPGEGLTIVVSFPKGIVTEPTLGEKIAHAASSRVGPLAMLGGLIVVLAFYFVAWMQVGVDPPKGQIAPRERPPEGFSAAALRYIRRMGADPKTFSVSLISMAIRGYLHIEQRGKRDFFIIRGEAADDVLAEEERAIAEALFSKGNRVELDDANHAIIGGAQRAFMQSLKEQLKSDYFRRNGVYIFLGLILSVGAVALGTAAAGGAPSVVWTGVTILMLLLVNIVFGILLKAPTREGRRIMDETEGFRMYLNGDGVARYSAQNDPEGLGRRFEEFLPFAIALDRESEWANEFTRALHSASSDRKNDYEPSWYCGPAWRAGAAYEFTDALSGTFATVVASSATAPGSSSGGGGGGFSGGGGGGGGGGGW